jgi:hypothetical protein
MILEMYKDEKIDFKFTLHHSLSLIKNRHILTLSLEFRSDKLFYYSTELLEIPLGLSWDNWYFSNCSISKKTIYI